MDDGGGDSGYDGNDDTYMCSMAIEVSVAFISNSIESRKCSSPKVHVSR